MNMYVEIRKEETIPVMTKQQTNIIKGVAILMMIFYHLFNRVGSDYHGLCQPLLYIGERPLVNIIANACHPVAFFLILSGYGLSYVWENKGNNLRQQGRRILKLYIYPIGSLWPSLWGWDALLIRHNIQEISGQS